MALTKDDIDAVSMMLHVDGELTFSVMLTRGGLTQRRGSSDEADPRAIMVKGRTDRCFEDFMAALPESLLEGGGAFEDPGRQGARHEWRFEFGGGMESLAWAIAYHGESASLPDEFADMVVQAERLTHSWYLAGVAEEAGQPLSTAAEAAPAPKPKRPVASARQRPADRRPGAGARRGPGPAVPLSRERLGLVVLLDLIAFTLPWSLLQWAFVGDAERVGPPGAGLVLFALLEFVLLRIARRSPGYWLLGVTAELGQKPVVHPSWPLRESPATLAVGIGSCALGVAGLTSWTAYHVAVPYFGLGLPLWLTLPLTLLGSAALVLGGVLVLRLDARGTWVLGGVGLLLLLSGATGWSAWGPFVDAALDERAASVGRPVGEGLLGDLARSVTPILTVVVPAGLLGGLYPCWRRLTRGPVARAGVGARTS